MWYLYDENYIVISKSETEPVESNKVYYDEELDLDMYKVTVGSIQDVDGRPTITYIAKKLKSNYELAQQIKEQNSLLVLQQEQLASIQDAIDFILMA